MDKLKRVPRAYLEVAVTAILLMALVILWNAILKEYVVLSDQGLSTIGIASSTSVGVLTAIVVSFVLVTWQSSRQERSTSFWRWRNALHQLVDFYDVKVEVLREIQEEVLKLTSQSSAVALVAPMPRNTFEGLVKAVWAKLVKVGEGLQKIKNPSPEQVVIGRAYMDIGNYLVLLTHANFEHNLAHHLYRRVLSLRGLLYRLLVVLMASILVVAMGVTASSTRFSDVTNAPLAVVLTLWVAYVLTHLGLEIRKVSLLEDELRRQEAENKEIFSK